MKCNRIAWVLAGSMAMALAACGGGGADDREGEEAIADGAPEMASPVGDNSADDDNVSAFPQPSAQQREAAKRASADMDWHFKPGWALFGPPESEGVLTVRCGGPSDVARGVLVSRAGDRDVNPGATGQLRFLGETESGQVTLTAEQSEMFGSVWTGKVRDPEAFARLFTQNQQPLIVTFDGKGALAVPPAEDVKDLIEECTSTG